MANQQINVDITPGQANPIVHCSQADVGRQVIITLVDGDSQYSIPSGATPEIAGKKQDKCMFVYSDNISVSGSNLTITLKDQMTACPGPVMCEIRIRKNQTVMGTANFILMVEGGVLDGVVSTSEIAIIAQVEASISVAQTAAENASASAVAAAASAGSAAGSASSAADSATSAGNAAVAAAQSASDADSYAQVAQNAASNAGSNASAAAASASNASASETNAANSATAASQSASAAAGSAQNAGVSETNAETYMTNAQTAATNAGNSATAAAQSASNANSDAQVAQTAATNAGSSASAAAASATNAGTAETNASNSASAAAQSAADAANASKGTAAQVSFSSAGIDPNTHLITVACPGVTSTSRQEIYPMPATSAANIQNNSDLMEAEIYDAGQGTDEIYLYVTNIPSTTTYYSIRVYIIGGSL